MSIHNYFIIGVVCAFLSDILLVKLKNHPQIKLLEWGWVERLAVILIWPIALIVFIVAFFKAYYKK